MKTVTDYDLIVTLLKQRYYKQVALSPWSEDFRKILSKYPSLLCALNHGPMNAPLATVPSLLELTKTYGGEQRIPLTIVWRQFYKLPVLKQIFSYITQTDRGLTVDSTINYIKQGKYTDLLVMPEGTNCWYGNGESIQPFMSARFIEIALRLHIPILLIVHHGTASWTKPMKISSAITPRLKWLPKKHHLLLKQSGTINLPRIFCPRIPIIRYAVQIYHPTITLTDLKTNKQKKDQLLRYEANRIKATMQQMLDKIIETSASEETSVLEPA